MNDSGVATRAGDRVLGMALTLVAGCLLAGQARINGELAQRIGDGLVAALVSFGIGVAILLAVLVASPRVRRGLGRVRHAAGHGDLRVWHLLGGMGGAFLVACQGLAVGAIGVALFTISVVCGQTLSSLGVDRAGLAMDGTRPITPARVAGAVLAVAAVALAVGDQLGAPTRIGLAVLPLLAGVGIVWQQAANGKIRATAGNSAATAALVNFAVGTALLLVVVAVDVAVRGLPAPLPADPLLYLGGLLGVLAVAIGAYVVRLTGVLILGLGTVAGQLITAVALDLLVPAAEHRPGATTIAGAALMLVALTIAARSRSTIRH